jgi:hypothetical protein
MFVYLFYSTIVYYTGLLYCMMLKDRFYLALSTFLSTILAIFTPIAFLYHTMLTMVLVDFLVCFIRLWRRRLRRGIFWEIMIDKLFVLLFYMLSISVIWLIEHFLINRIIGLNSMYATMIVTTFFCLVQLKLIFVGMNKACKTTVFTQGYNKIKNYFRVK